MYMYLIKSKSLYSIGLENIDLDILVYFDCDKIPRAKSLLSYRGN